MQNMPDKEFDQVFKDKFDSFELELLLQAVNEIADIATTLPKANFFHNFMIFPPSHDWLNTLLQP